MMNHMNGMIIARDNLVSFHRSMFFAQRLHGVLNHFAERWKGKKTVSMFKMGYDSFSNCLKSSSALVLTIKNDRSVPSAEARKVAK